MFPSRSSSCGNGSPERAAALQSPDPAWRGARSRGTSRPAGRGTRRPTPPGRSPCSPSRSSSPSRVTSWAVAWSSPPSSRTRGCGRQVSSAAPHAGREGGMEKGMERGMPRDWVPSASALQMPQPGRDARSALLLAQTRAQLLGYAPVKSAVTFGLPLPPHHHHVWSFPSSKLQSTDPAFHSPVTPQKLLEWEWGEAATSIACLSQLCISH